MDLFRMFSRGATAAHKRILFVKRAIFALVIAALFAGCAGCSQCGFGGGGRSVGDLSDIADFSIVFIDGEATLYWTDPRDASFDHVEVSWDPGGVIPVTVAGGIEKLIVPGLELDQVYNFTVKAVDRNGNVSGVATGGTGRALKQRRSPDAPPWEERLSIKGTPTANQVTLSWDNFDPSEYEYIEITFAPGYESVYRVPKGVGVKTLSNLTNNVEHTFYVAAVNSVGDRKSVDGVGLFISSHATSPESVFGKPKDGQVTLVWVDPRDPSLSHLEVTYGPGGEVPMNVAKGVQTKDITNLSDNVEYEFFVYAMDIYGHRRPVPGVSMQTPDMPPVVPQEPVRVERPAPVETVTVGTVEPEFSQVRGRPVGGQIRLDWNDPALAGLDHVEIVRSPGGENTPVSVARGVQTHTFTGLSDTTDYGFQVYGVDSAGNRQAVQGLRSFTQEVPRITARPVSGEVTIAWDDPTDPGFTHVELSYRPGGTTPVSVQKGVGKHTFTGLSDNQEYEFSVNAVVGGNIQAITPKSAVVPQIPVLVGTPANGQLSLSWDDPPNVRVDHFEVSYTPGGERAVTIPRGTKNRNFTGLTNGREYAFTLYAVDNTGNKHPVNSPRLVAPEPELPPPPPPTPASPPPIEIPPLPPDPEPPPPPPSPPREGLGPLSWSASANTGFGESTVLTISQGTADNGSLRWVAGGMDGKIAYSENDGVSWRLAADSTFNASAINSIGYGSGRWIAVGRNGRIAWSTNGASWTAVGTTHFASDQTINSVVFANGRWLAGGSNGIVIWSVDNGVTWNRVVINSFGPSTINTLAFRGNRWVAGGTQGKMAYSNDNGITWVAVANSTFNQSDISVIINDRNRWYAGGYGQRVAWSSDGVTWRALTRPFYILGMGYNGNRWVAGGQDGRMAWSGDAGDTWNTDSAGRNLFGVSWVQAVMFGRSATGGGRWVAVGQGGKIIFADEQQ